MNKFQRTSTIMKKIETNTYSEIFFSRLLITNNLYSLGKYEIVFRECDD